MVEVKVIEKKEKITIRDPSTGRTFGSIEEFRGRRSGGGGSKFREEFSRLQQEQARKAAEQKALAEQAKAFEEARVAGRTAAAKRIAEGKQLAGAERKALLTRERITRSGEGFTRRQIKQELGGRKGVAALRRARAKGFVVERKKVVAPKISAKEVQEIPTGRVTVPPEPTNFLGRSRLRASRFRDRVFTKRARREKVTSFEKFGAGLGAGAALSLIGTAEFGASLLTEPIETVKRTAVSIKEVGRKVVTGEGFPAVSKVIIQEPGFAAGFLASEIFTAKGLGKVASKSLDLSRAAATRVSPSFVKIKDSKLIIPKPKAVVLDVDIPKRAFVEIEVVRPGIKKITTSLKEQARVAGKTIDAVSAQRSLFSVAKKEIKIDKPKPTPGAPEIERSFFADPKGRLRISRLGLQEQKQASLVDILSGDVSFRRERPQAIIFPDALVEAFPKRLRKVERKLKGGKQLTPSEAKAFEEFQLKPSGKFKPVGFLSKEPEVTLAPGEIIRGKRAGRTLIGGRPVDIFTAEIVKEVGGGIDDVFLKPSKIKRKTTRKVVRESDLDSFSRQFESRPRISRAVFPSRIPSLSKGARRSITSRKSIRRLPRDPFSRVSASITKDLGSIDIFTPGRRTTKGKRRITPTPGRGRLPASFFEPPTPKPIIPKSDELLRIKKRKKRLLFPKEEAVFFSPGFIEKTFGIKRKITKKEIREIARSGDPFRGRPIPIIID